MATMNASEVGIGSGAVTGAIWIAPDNTALPTDATTTLASAYKLLGFTSEEGVVITETRSTQDIRAWEGRTVVYVATTEYSEDVSFTPIQCNSDVLKATYGDDYVEVAQDGTIHARHHGGTLSPVMVVIETIPFEGAVKRYCGKFQLAERGQITLDGTVVDGRSLTYRALAVDGVTMHEYLHVS